MTIHRSPSQCREWYFELDALFFQDSILFEDLSSMFSSGAFSSGRTCYIARKQEESMKHSRRRKGLFRGFLQSNDLVYSSKV